MNDIRYAVFNTPAGWVGAAASSRGCLSTTFPQESAAQAKQALGEIISQAVDSPQFFEILSREFQAFFEGKRVNFTTRLDLTQASNFERSVWEATGTIPHGQTRSYAWIANQIGKPQAARAVGQALGRNPLPILIPCHRVITSTGKLGGFGGGLDMKRYLLELETRKTTST